MQNYEKELKNLMKTIRIYSQYIGLEFSIEKCVELLNVPVTVIPVVIRALRMASKGLDCKLEQLEIRRRFEIIQIRTVLRLAMIQRRVLET